MKYGGYRVRWVAEAYVSATKQRSQMALAGMLTDNGAVKHVWYFWTGRVSIAHAAVTNLGPDLGI